MLFEDGLWVEGLELLGEFLVLLALDVGCLTVGFLFGAGKYPCENLAYWHCGSINGFTLSLSISIHLRS